MGLAQRVHPKLIAKIQELVSIGTVEPIEVQRLLKHHVNHYMCAGNLPDPNDRAYYPCLDDIKNHIAKAKRALQISVVDQENAVKLTQKQQELSPDSKYYFRPYKCKDPANTYKSNVKELESADFENTLLWLHQEPWQQLLMTMYGNTISLTQYTL